MLRVVGLGEVLITNGYYSWGDARGQSSSGPTRSSWWTGGWQPSSQYSRSWGNGRQTGHFGPTAEQQSSDRGAEAGSNHSSDGAARTPEPALSQETDDQGDVAHAACSEELRGTSTTREPGPDRDAPVSSRAEDAKGLSSGKRCRFPPSMPRAPAGVPFIPAPRWPRMDRERRALRGRPLRS